MENFITGMPCNCGSTPCESYTISVTSNGYLYFINCDGVEQVVTIYNGNSLTFCAQKGKAFWNGTQSFSAITDNGACTTPPVICNLWETYDPAYFEYIDCNGTYQYQYLDYGSTICVQNGYFVTGPIYNTGNYCDF